MTTDYSKLQKVSARATDKDWRDVIVNETTALVSFETWRPGKDGDAGVQNNLTKIYEHFQTKANDFNRTLEPDRHSLNVKCDDITTTDGGKKYRVFRFRAGLGTERRVSLICHLDTVPPGNYDWDPFNARVETRIYKGVPSEFLIGRGTIDDKGPAVVAFEAFLRALRTVKAVPEGLTLEVLFDTSEETDMSTTKYLNANPSEMPTFGIVFDSSWSVRAEKGIERPTFTVSEKDITPSPDSEGLVIAELFTAEGSVNMIPVTAGATIKGTGKAFEEFVQKVEAWYRTARFDDSEYHPAEMSVSVQPGCAVITTKVAGAQHGSAPHQNRQSGANPLVSLTNFLATLVDRGVLARNFNGEMCRFVRWVFGTRVFGENQPDLLYRFDSVFTEGNGTTYALTQLTTDPVKQTVTLAIDVRYAIGHHEKGWDGSEGQIPGGSLFKAVFQRLIERYVEDGGARFDFNTTNKRGPDIRNPHSENLFSIGMAYRAVMGENCPMAAIGGSTDAHGYLHLVTAGSLFTENLGPPVNYHGIDEGAPLSDLENSGKILLHLIMQELNPAPVSESYYAGLCRCEGCGN